MYKNKNIYISIFFVIGLFLYAQSAHALIFRSQPVGIQVGDGTTSASAPGDNLIYGVLGPSSQGNLLLLQNGTGIDKFKIDTDGSATSFTGGTYSLGQLCGGTGTQCFNFNNDNWVSLSNISGSVYGGQGLAADKLWANTDLYTNAIYGKLGNGGRAESILLGDSNDIIQVQGTNLYFTQTGNDHFWVDSKRGIQMRIDSDNNSSDTFTVVNGENSPVFTVDESGNVTNTGAYIGSGSGITSINASNISSGTVPSARLPLGGSIEFGEWGSTCSSGEIPKWNGSDWACSGDATGSNLWVQSGPDIYYTAGDVGIGTPTQSTKLDVSGTVSATLFSGSGASISTLNASNLSSGTVPLGRLSSITSTQIATNIISSLDGVTNDGGAIDLIAGSGIILTPDDPANAITIAAAEDPRIGQSDDACGVQTVFGKLNCLLGGSYFYVSHSMNWTLARDYCVAQGARLANIANSTQNLSLQTVIPAGGSAWIGANDIAVEGSWVWLNEGQLVYSNWRSGEPNNSGNEDCARFREWDGLWNDWKCGNKSSFVCEYN